MHEKEGRQWRSKMPPAQRFGFVALAAVTGTALTKIGLHPFFTLLIACTAGFLGSAIVRALVTPRPATVKIGKENFTYTRYDRDARKRSLEVLLGSLYYYCIVGTIVWALLSWAVVAFAFGDPLFFLTARATPAQFSTESLNRIYLVVFYVGLSLAVATWIALYISEVAANEALARLLPLGLGLCAGYAQYHLLRLVPLWSCLLTGLINPFIVIPRATSMCIRAGLRGRQMSVDAG